MDLVSMIEHCAPTVAPATMAQILRVESAFRPYAIGAVITKDGQRFQLAYQPTDKAQAISWVGWLSSHGYRFDAGIAQINSNNFQRLGLTVDSMFDPCASIAAGGKVLTEFHQRAVLRFGMNQTALRAAISAYQTGSFTRGFGTGYVQRVIGGDLFSARTVGSAAITDGANAPSFSPTGVAFSVKSLAAD